MLKLQNGEVIYNNSETLGAVEVLQNTGEGFSITLSDGLIIFIPEEDCTEAEKEVFQAYHEYYKNTDGLPPVQEIIPTLEQIISAKVAELDKAYNDEILGGFYSDIKNGNRLYGLGYDDQINMEALKNNVSLGLIVEGTLEYYAKGQPCEAWTNTEFMTLYGQAMTFKTDRIKTCKAKKALAEAATTVAELELIVWEAYGTV